MTKEELDLMHHQLVRYRRFSELKREAGDVHVTIARDALDSLLDSISVQQDYIRAQTSTSTDTKGDNVREAGQPVGVSIETIRNKWGECADNPERFEDWLFSADPAPERSETVITDAMVEAAKCAYWHEVHHGDGYGDGCYRAALRAALGQPRTEPSEREKAIRECIAAVAHALVFTDTDFQADKHILGSLDALIEKEGR